MKNAILICSILFLIGSSTSTLYAQPTSIKPTHIITGQLIKTSKALSELTEADTIPRSHPIRRKAKPGYHPKNDWILHEKTNPNALPLGEDPALQKKYDHSKLFNPPGKNFNGNGNTGVDPADPTMDVGPNHIVQMVNDPDGTLIQIWDKLGNVVLAPLLMDAVTGIHGLGDPIVIYDHIADRWLLTEFGDDAVVGNKLICMVSQTADPLGAYHIYSFDTPFFPDYPKYSLWPNAYLITTNEDDVQAVYAMDRAKMLAGAPATMQRFADIDHFQTIGFQASTPVGLSGTMSPSGGAPGMFMRMADDGWTGVATDHLQIWELNVDFINSANSSLTGPLMLPTQPFDTNLCGFTSFSCIRQPGNGSERLDPLREVIMNRAFYRNFGTHESIVCSHVTDAGGDRAGVRWYELRREGVLPWAIYQQGTYAPDDGNSRWMSSIAINADGSIGLAFNISSSTTFPSLAYTGRTSCDPLNAMTTTETIAKAGSGSNASNRYGDYNDMNVDPSDGSFWFTGMYNPSSNWDTYIANYTINSNCMIPDCDTPTDLNGNIADGTYRYANELTSSGTIGPLGNVHFVSGLSVSLEPNFNISSTAIFQASIANCNE